MTILSVFCISIPDHLMDFNETLYELHTNVGYLNAAVFNFVQWQTPKLVRWEHH